MNPELGIKKMIELKHILRSFFNIICILTVHIPIEIFSLLEIKQGIRVHILNKAVCISIALIPLGNV